MSWATNKVEWCVNKAQDEIKQTDTHRGLVKTKPDMNKAKEHMTKAEHFLKASEYLKKGGFSDISATTSFYCMYHSLLAMTVKFGYQSRNQICTFALILQLIEEHKIDFDKELMDRITTIDPDKGEKTGVQIRENFQYDTVMSMEDPQYQEMVNLANEVKERAEEVVES